jgi:glycosyltransferase involved in cell wall biosynthesis
MKISFIVNSTFGEAVKDLTYSERLPMGGSENTMQNIALAFQRNGHEVNVYLSDEPEAQTPCDVCILLRDWRPAEVWPKLPGKTNYLWCQDDTNQALVEDLANKELAERVYAKLDRIFLLSNYQALQWVENLNCPQRKIFLTTNNIPFHLFEKFTAESLVKRPPHAYFASIPWRGLNPLLKAWPHVTKLVPDARLFIFSSQKLYNLSDTNPELLSLYEQAKNDPTITYSEPVGHIELREKIKTCRALAYPCIFKETSCITAMEAMASGCAVVSTALGALPETAVGNPLIQPHEPWLEAWIETLIRILVDNEFYLQIAFQNMITARFYDSQYVSERWQHQFRYDLLTKGFPIS